jgi:general secretion pathway protein G
MKEEALTMQDMTRVKMLGRALTRGVTLVEILVVVAIMGLVAAGVGFAVIPKFKQAQIDTTSNSMREIRNAAARWKALKGGDDCPTVSQLKQDKEIDSASKLEDAWGSAYKIQCTDDEIIVTSPGPDKKEGTADDIAIPKDALGKH